MVSFYEMQKRVVSKNGFVIGDMTDAEDLLTLSLVKAYLNDAQEIVYQNRMSWQKKEARITLKASYSTGTLTATNNSATLTGSGTTWTRDMEGQKIIITDGTDGAVVYRIKSFTSATELVLDTKYINVGGVSLAYVVYYDTYALPQDFKSLEIMQDVSPLRSYINDENYLLSSSNTSSVPTECKFLGARTSAYYESGTVSITKSATSVVGVGTAFDATMVGRYILLNTYGKLYEITAVADTTHLTIDKGFGDTTIAGGNFKIDPEGLLRIRFHSAPSAVKLIPYTYWAKPIRLQDDNDISPVPSDMLLVLGGIWKYYANEDNPLQQQAKKDFYEVVAQLGVEEIDAEQADFPPTYE